FATHIMGPYEWDAHDISVKGVFTNNLIAGAMRGFGVNQACFALESMIDRLASKLGLSPLKIREMNMVRDGRKMGLGEIASNSEGLYRSFEAVSKRFDPEAINEFNMKNDKRKRAFGIAIAHKNISLGNNSPRDVSHIRISISHNVEKITLHSGASDIGQGIYNILRQLASEATGICLEKITVDFGKTLTAPPAGVTSASRQTFMSGNAVVHGCEYLISELAKRISANLKIAGSAFEIKGEKIIFKEKIPIAHNDIKTIWNYISVYEKEGFEVTYKFDAPRTSESFNAGKEGFRSHFAYSFATHGVLIETDLETKKFKILKIVAAHDVGRAINPKSLYGQIVGGVVMGLGYAVSEHISVTPDGLVDARGMSALGLLKAAQVPPVETVIIESPHPEGPFGARGIGEISTVPIAAALCNALRNATGLEFNTLPINMNENGFKYSPEL
ncbi:MAG TPA: molybdopterin-dependent oxidoreductase, partial [Candidatus Wallbacteria bacterium]|nr:molybdopterin-dependent oxidoreductase [Candidatus Wallbacteria bacterium]